MKHPASQKKIMRLDEFAVYTYTNYLPSSVYDGNDTLKITLKKNGTTMRNAYRKSLGYECLGMLQTSKSARSAKTIASLLRAQPAKVAKSLEFFVQQGIVTIQKDKNAKPVYRPYSTIRQYTVEYRVPPTANDILTSS